MALPTSRDKNRPLRLLCIGNSFSDDAIAFAYDVARSLNLSNVTMATLYIAGCSIRTHVKCAAEELPAYDYRKNTEGAWITTPKTKLSTALSDEDWDIITMQQGSGDSGRPETFALLPSLIAYVKERCPKASLVWHMTWAYQGNSDHGGFLAYNRDQTTMYRSIVNCVTSEVLPTGVFERVIANGTAVQNVRTSYLGDTLTRDGYHLSIPEGRYLAALNLVAAVTGLPIDDIAYAPDGISDSFKAVAIEAVNASLSEPFAVTPSRYTQK